MSNDYQVGHTGKIWKIWQVPRVGRLRQGPDGSCQKSDGTTLTFLGRYARLVDEWVTAVGLRNEDYGAHSLRRTTASIIYKATGNLCAAQILLGHTKIENIVRYFGVDVEDALTPADSIEV